ncbi:MAG TPA: alpha-amylase family glycosyl hydrolase [archaeon]|nr:alpha-amylase family glycosyl hydrolase [archaeon]
MAQKPALIYNLFPLLAGPMPAWKSHFERAAGMGFNWIFINPIQDTGFSGSLYAIKDYYRINPLFVKKGSPQKPEKQLARALEEAHKLGLKVMLDLVINHTAIDSPLVKKHPKWYLRDPQGKVKNPGVWEGDRLVTVWGDLAEIDNWGSPDKESLWNWWWDVSSYYLGLGFDGFRCDAAYKVPQELWRFIFTKARDKFPETTFFAESLGCTIDKVVELAEAGFDYVFNSSKYWNFTQPWCLTQYEESRKLAPSISFAESHDTQRLITELNGNLDAVRQRYVFSALFSTGVMIPVGFEFGFRNKLHVVQTRPEDWEKTDLDLRDFISNINRFKLEHSIFCAEHPTYNFHLQGESGSVSGIIKLERESGPSVLMLINRDTEKEQRVVVGNLYNSLPGSSRITLTDPAGSFEPEPVSEQDFDRQLPPAALWLLMRD